MRKEAPVFPVSIAFLKIWLVTRYDDVAEMLGSAKHDESQFADTERLFRRWPALRLSRPAESLRWRSAVPLRGLEALPVSWG
jgi:cytochrome P450